mgnify:CR=1 FL=1
MLVNVYWKVLSLLLLTLLLSSCSSWNALKTVEIKTVEVDRNIPIQNRPQPIKMNTEMRWWVVTEETLVAYVLSVKDYETLALNMAEIKRYIEQQKSIIVYYEKAVAPIPKETKLKEK